MSTDEVVWDRVDVSDWPVSHIETAGSSKVVWLKHPGSGELWLHKSIHVPTNGVPQGEDWAEVVATQVGMLLGVPCADTRLCVRDGVRGSLSRSLILKGCDLNEGGVVLEAAGVPGYFRHTDRRKAEDPARPGVRRPGHSLANIQAALRDVEPPECFEGPGGCSGFDVFAGFMVLDALVANRDRHEQNWAVLRPRLTDHPERLAPSYDHGGSLGYNLSDDQRHRLSQHDSTLRKWAVKGTAHRFEHTPPAQTLVAVASAATTMCSSIAADWWRGRLSTLDLDSLHMVLARGISGMSVPAATFSSRLLELNLRRLRDAIRSSP